MGAGELGSTLGVGVEHAGQLGMLGLMNHAQMVPAEAAGADDRDTGFRVGGQNCRGEACLARLLILRGLHLGHAGLLVARQVRDQTKHALEHHELRPMVHFMLFRP